MDRSCLDIIQFHPTSNFREYNPNRSLFVLKTSAVFYPGSLLLLPTVSTPTYIFFWLKTPINLIPEQLITYPQTWQVYVVQTNVSGSHFGLFHWKNLTSSSNLCPRTIRPSSYSESLTAKNRQVKFVFWLGINNHCAKACIWKKKLPDEMIIRCIYTCEWQFNALWEI